MESRIILSQADFSANNIGQYIVLNDLTKKVLAKQTQYNEQSNEAAALNTFLLRLTEGGFIGGSTPKLKTLFIPALAGSHAELLYNIANLDINGYPVNEMSNAEQSAIDGQQVYTLKTSNAKNIALKTYSSADVVNASSKRLLHFHLFDNAMQNVDSTSFIGYILNSTVPAYASIIIHESNGARFLIKGNAVSLKYGNDNVVSNTVSGNWNGFYGLSYNKTDSTFESTSDNVTLGTASVGSGSTVVSNNYDNFNINAANDSATHIEHAFFACGSYLTPTEITTLKGYVNTLLTALNVINA